MDTSFSLGIPTFSSTITSVYKNTSVIPVLQISDNCSLQIHGSNILRCVPLHIMRFLTHTEAGCYVEIDFASYVGNPAHGHQFHAYISHVGRNTIEVLHCIGTAYKFMPIPS